MLSAMATRGVAVVGLGRVGSTVALAMGAAGVAPLHIWDRRASVRRTARRLLPRARVWSDAGQAMGAARIAVLALPDDALRQVVPGVPLPAIVAHTSGRLTAGELVSFQRRGVRTASWHPLRSFAGRFEATSLEHVVFAIEGDAGACRALATLARRLGGSPVTLDAGTKDLYHAAAAMTANHALILAHTAEAWLAECGVPPRQRRRGLGQLLGSAADQLTERGAALGLTGPLARGDVAAVAAHLAAIAAVDPAGLELYRATALAALARGGVLESLAPAVRVRLRKVLRVGTGGF